MHPTEASNAIRTRSLDESIRHAHDAASRVEATLSLLMDDLTGMGRGGADANECRPTGLIYSADELAARIEALARLAHEVKERIVADKLQGLMQGAGSARGLDRNMSNTRAGSGFIG